MKESEVNFTRGTGEIRQNKEEVAELVSWETRAASEVMGFTLSVPENLRERLFSEKQKLTQEEKERRFFVGAQKIWRFADNLRPSVLSALAKEPDTGLSKRAVNQLENLPIRIRNTGNLWLVLEFFGAQKELKDKEYLENDDLSFLPETITLALKSFSLYLLSGHKSVDEQQLVRRQTIITKELTALFFIWRMVLEGASPNKIREYFNDGFSLQGDKICSQIAFQTFSNTPHLPMNISKFMRGKTTFLPEEGWDQSLEFAQALAIIKAYNPPSNRFGVIIQGDSPILDKFNEKYEFVRSLENHDWKVIKSIFQKAHTIFINFGSLSWLALLLSRPDAVYPSIDFSLEQKIEFLRTSFLLSGQRIRKAQKYRLNFTKGVSNSKIGVEVAEVAASLGNPLYGVHSCNLIITEKDFGRLTERGDAPNDWYENPEIENFFYFHLFMNRQEHLSIGELFGYFFPQREYTQMIQWKNKQAIPNKLKPYIDNYYYQPIFNLKERRKEAVLFMAQIFFRHGEEVIWELKRRMPKTDLHELAKCFVEIDSQFCDLRTIPISQLRDWKVLLPKAAEDWQFILEPNIDAAGEVPVKGIRLKNVLRRLRDLGLSESYFFDFQLIIRNNRDFRPETVIEGWLNSFSKKTAELGISPAAAVALFGVILLQRSVLFDQGHLEYRLLQVLGLTKKSNGTPDSYRKRGYSKKALTDEFYGQAIRCYRQAKTLEMMGTIIAEKAGIGENGFSDAEELFENSTKAEGKKQKYTLSPTFLRFLSGGSMNNADGSYCSLNSGKYFQGRNGLTVGDGILAYQNYRWAAADEIVLDSE